MSRRNALVVCTVALVWAGCTVPSVFDEVVAFRRVPQPPGTQLKSVATSTSLDALKPRIEAAWNAAGTARSVVVAVEPGELNPPYATGGRSVILTRAEQVLRATDLGDLSVEGLTVEETSYPVYEAPGWFDVGAGFGVVVDAVKRFENNDALGTFLSAKAYPAGRWYTQAVRSVAGDSGRQESVTLATATGFEQFLKRWSVTYGVSIGDLDGNIIAGAAHHLGIGFDVSPDFALVAGVAFFELEDGLSYGSVDQAMFLGVALNLNAFRGMFANKASFAEVAGK